MIVSPAMASSPSSAGTLSATAFVLLSLVAVAAAQEAILVGPGFDPARWQPLPAELAPRLHTLPWN